MQGHPQPSKPAPPDAWCVCCAIIGKVYLRLDQPKTALDTYMRALEQHPSDVHVLLGIARTHDMLCDFEKGVEYYKTILAARVLRPHWRDA